jgi:hypothetical protein
MAILTARSLEGVLQEASGFLSHEQLKRLLARLNRSEEDALAAEWELIVLAALSFVGIVQHEPPFGGNRKLDFQFAEPTTGVKLVGDVTSLCDSTIQKNSVEYLSSELSRRLELRGICGQISISVACELGENGVMLPRLPDPHEFRHYVFGNEFAAFTHRIIANLARTHKLDINNKKAQLAIQYSPGQWTTMMTYRAIRSPRDITNNIIHHALGKKRKQIKDSGHPEGDGWRCIVLCDGDCVALSGRKTWDTHSAAEIVNQYLRNHRSLDLVVCLSVRERAAPFGNSREHQLEFDVEAFDGPKSRAADSIRQLFKSGLDRLPQPVRHPANAKSYLERRSNGKVFFDGRRGTSYSSHELSLSSRSVFDYLAGRIERATFETFVNYHPLEILKARLDEGCLPEEVTLLKSKEKDDDTVFVRLGRPDPAVAPFFGPESDSAGDQ